MVFIVPLLILICVQTKNMISNETTSERFSKKKEKQESGPVEEGAGLLSNAVPELEGNKEEGSSEKNKVEREEEK